MCLLRVKDRVTSKLRFMPEKQPCKRCLISIPYDRVSHQGRQRCTNLPYQTGTRPVILHCSSALRSLPSPRCQHGAHWPKTDTYRPLNATFGSPNIFNVNFFFWYLFYSKNYGVWLCGPMKPFHHIMGRGCNGVCTHPAMAVSCMTRH